MTKMCKVAIGLTVVAALLTGGVLVAQSGYDLFQKALAAERADGDLREAVRLYERVVKEFSGDRALVARALIRIAECHEKLGEQDAAAVYERVVRDFSDQAESAGVARARLAMLRSPAAATASRPSTRQIWGSGSDPMGSPSPDGRFLSFTDWETGDLAIRDLTRAANRRLTNTGGWDASGDYAEYSVISPDGRHVAYSWFRDKTGSPDNRCICRYELRSLAIAGDAPSSQVLHSSPETLWIRPTAWTPDGRSVVVIRQLLDRTNQIALVPATGGSIRVLKSLEWRYPERVSISPDGRFLAYDAPADAQAPTRDIFILAVDGSRESKMVGDPSHDHSPLWSSDGSTLLFVSDRTGTDSLWRVPVANGQPAGVPAVAMPNLGAGVFPLGTTRAGAVYYSFGGPISNIYLADLDADLTASAPPTLATTRFFNSNLAPSWSPDGTLLAYLSRRGSSESPGSTALVIRSAATGEEREVSMSVLPLDRVSWFPDGRSLLVASRDLTKPRYVYHRVDLMSGRADLLHQTATLGGIPGRRPELTPDGRSILYVEQSDDERFTTSRLMRVLIATGEITVVKDLPDGRYFTSFALSPDGALVAAIVSGGLKGQPTALQVLSLAGGEERELYASSAWGDGTRYSGVTWTRDGRHLLFVRPEQNGATAVSKIAVAEGAAEEVGISMNGTTRLPALHPAGRRLAVAVATPAVREVWALEHFLPASNGTR